MKEEKERRVPLWGVYRVYYEDGGLFTPFQILGFSVEHKKSDVDLPEERIKKEFKKAVLEKHGGEPNFDKVVLAKHFYNMIEAKEYAKKHNDDEERKRNLKF